MITTPNKNDLVSALFSRLQATLEVSNIGALAVLVDAYINQLITAFKAAEQISKNFSVHLSQINSAETWVLDALAGIIGLRRLPGSNATITLTLTGGVGTIIPQGSSVEHQNPFSANELSSLLDDPRDFNPVPDFTFVWETGEEVQLKIVPTIADLGGPAQVLPIGTRFQRSLGGEIIPAENRVYQITVAGNIGSDPGTGANSAYPFGDQIQFQDGTAVFRYLGEGTAAEDVVAIAVDNDARLVEPGALVNQNGVNGDPVLIRIGIVTITDEIEGWASVVNLGSSSEARKLETNEAFINRIKFSGAHNTNNRFNADSDGDIYQSIRSSLIKLPGVISVQSAELTTEQAVEVLILGGDDQIIAEEIFRLLPIGIFSGDGGGTITTINVLRADGQFQAITFGRPIETTFLIDIAITVQSELYPGDEAVTNAIETLSLTNPTRPPFERQQMGQDIHASALACILINEVPGITDVSSLTVNSGASAVVQLSEAPVLVVNSLTVTLE